jgi:hypothetical protein
MEEGGGKERGGKILTGSRDGQLSVHNFVPDASTGRGQNFSRVVDHPGKSSPDPGLRLVGCPVGANDIKLAILKK